MKLTPPQLKMLFKAWDAGSVDVPNSDFASKDGSPLKDRRIARSLERLKLIQKNGSIIKMVGASATVDGYDIYGITQKGVERLLDPSALLAREVLEG